MTERTCIEEVCLCLGINNKQKIATDCEALSLYSVVSSLVIKPLVDRLLNIYDLNKVIDKLCSPCEHGVFVSDTHQVLTFLRSLGDNAAVHSDYSVSVHTFFHNMLDGYTNKTPTLICAKKAGDDPVLFTETKIVSVHFVSINYTEQHSPSTKVSKTIGKSVDMELLIDSIIVDRVFPPIPENYCILYHSTTHFQSINVASNPRHDTMSSIPSNKFDFGHAFYLTNDIKTATMWAIDKSAHGTATPAVVAFCVPLDLAGLTSYSYYNYDSSRQESFVYPSFFSDVEMFRRGSFAEYSSLLNDYDVICGPTNRNMCRTLNTHAKKKGNSCPVYVSVTHPSQFAFRTKKATKFIMEHTRWTRVILLMEKGESTPPPLTSSIL